MQYLMLTPADREALLGRLEVMPRFLFEQLGGLDAAAAVVRGPQDAFSPVEQCWHLADLEREGFAVRIRRLQEEDSPWLPDFDGARIARERDYRRRSLAEGLAAFAHARAATLGALRAVPEAAWTRAGTQEGVGPVSLCDLPVMMAEHDASHRAEIAAWRAQQRA